MSATARLRTQSLNAIQLVIKFVMNKKSGNTFSHHKKETRVCAL